MKTTKMTIYALAVLASLGITLSGCSDPSTGDNHSESESEGSHMHADGSTHDDHADDTGMGGEDNEHDETTLDPATIGDMTVELAQGHGAVEAGKESHLVVKLPYNDNGATVVRAWIGTEDRTLSFVGKGEYASAHDDFDIHAMAPSPLPENTMWWIEIEKPDGTKVVGSTKPIMD